MAGFGATGLPFATKFSSGNIFMRVKDYGMTSAVVGLLLLFFWVDFVVF